MGEQRWAARLLAGLPVPMALLGLFVPLALAPLGVVAGVVAARPVWCRRAWTALPPAFLVGLAAIAAWILLSAAWALDPHEALFGTAKLAGSAIFGLVLLAWARTAPDDAQQRLFPWLMVALGLAAAVLVTEALTHNGISDLIVRIKDHGLAPPPAKSLFERGATILTLMMWPGAILLRRRIGTARTLAVLLPIAAILCLGDSKSTILALAAAIGAGILTWAAPRRGPRLLSVLVLAVVLAMPVAALHLPPPEQTFQNWTWLPNSAHHRLTIWRFTAQHIADKPLFGWGMEASRSIPGADIEVTVVRTDARGNKVAELTEAQLPLHPHNSVLQWWLELGGVGAVGFAALAVVILTGIVRLQSDRAERAALAATVVAALSISAVSYGFWQSWWQAGLWLAAALCSVVTAGGSRDKIGCNPSCG